VTYRQLNLNANYKARLVHSDFAAVVNGRI